MGLQFSFFVRSGWIIHTFLCSILETEPAFDAKALFLTTVVLSCEGLWMDNIVGSWMGNGNVSRVDSGIRVFIVDALLYPEGSREGYDFMFRSDTLNDDNRRARKLCIVFFLGFFFFFQSFWRNLL